MSHLTVSVAASMLGWQRCEGLKRRPWFAQHSEALATANLMARTLHTNDGIATEVRMKMVGCESVMVAVQG